jgi:hypothetical protein
MMAPYVPVIIVRLRKTISISQTAQPSGHPAGLTTLTQLFQQVAEYGHRRTRAFLSWHIL